MSKEIKFGPYFKRTKTGATQQWEVIVEGNTFYTVEGQVDGVLTKSMPTVCEGKNTFKANQTSGAEQASKEAEARAKKKLESGYAEDIWKIDTAMKYFEPMLAKKYNDYKDSIKFPVIVQRKIDGSRLIAKADGLTTRNGKAYVSCPHIAAKLAVVFKKHPKWVIDGEIYSHDIPFEQIMSLVRKSKPTAEDLVESEKIVKLYIFDGVIDDVHADFVTRYRTIKDEIIKLLGKDKHFVFVDFDIANSDAEVMEFHRQYVSEGYEGVMVRVSSAAYENKRSKYLLKYKEFIDDEFVIVDVEEGVGNRSGMFGRFILKMKDGRTFGCNARGNMDYYTQLLKDSKKLIGKKVTVRYQELSDNGVPRFPVVINVDPLDR